VGGFPTLPQPPAAPQPVPQQPVVPVTGATDTPYEPSNPGPHWSYMDQMEWPSIMGPDGGTPYSTCAGPMMQQTPIDLTAPTGGMFTIGREITADLVVSDRSVDRRSCVIRFDNGGFVLDVTATNGVRINQQVVRESHRLSPGDSLNYSSGVVVRFVGLDPLSALVPCGHWVRLSATSSAVPHAGPAFSLRGGFRRGWLVSIRRTARRSRLRTVVTDHI
jgi:hypothetical protein